MEDKGQQPHSTRKRDNPVVEADVAEINHGLSQSAADGHGDLESDLFISDNQRYAIFAPHSQPSIVSGRTICATSSSAFLPSRSPISARLIRTKSVSCRRPLAVF
jgi:hypothetical protein